MSKTSIAGKDRWLSDEQEIESRLARVLREIPRLSLVPLRRRVDRVMSRSREITVPLSGQRISCEGAGCNDCCRGTMQVSGEELADIMPRIPDEAFDRVLDLKAELADDHLRDRVRCPILDRETGLCPIYEHRPFACRIYQVVSPREDCVVTPGTSALLVTKMMPNEAMFLIAKAMPEERDLLDEMLIEAERRKEGSE